MQGVFSFIRKVATTTAPVLLLGESGTGKEMAALAIHGVVRARMGRSFQLTAMPFRRICLRANYSVMRKALLPARTMQRKGLVETAKGGTLVPRRDRRAAA